MANAPDLIPADNQAPVSLVQLALDRQADVGTIERLCALQEHFEAKEARREFFRALSDFQSKQPAIEKLKQVKYGDTEYFYAPLGDIAEQIRFSLHECGLSYRFEQDHSDRIKVTCIISHNEGHEESTSMWADSDSSGRKNAVQSIGSTVTYLQRYTLISALGITTADSDMDARLSGETITPEQSATLKARLQSTNSNVKAFCKMLGVEDIDSLPASKFSQADKELSRKERKATSND